MDLSSEWNAAKLQNFSGVINIPKVNWQLDTSRVPWRMMVCPELCGIFHKQPRWWDVAHPHQDGRWKLNWKADTFEGPTLVQQKSVAGISSQKKNCIVYNKDKYGTDSFQAGWGSGCLWQLCCNGSRGPGWRQSEQNTFWTALAREQTVDQRMCLFQPPQHLLGYTRTMIYCSAPSGSGKILKAGVGPVDSYWDN